MSVELLLDSSAWARLAHPQLDPLRVDQVADALEQRRVATCLPFLLEAGYSARSARDHGDLMDELRALPLLRIDEEVEACAVQAQRQLARAGHHRLPPVDLIVAAVAACHGIGVLHYDADFDVIGAKTDLQFESVWLAPRGSL